MNILLIDNRDSFTFNLAEACERLGSNVETVRNNIDPNTALGKARSSEAIILLSPGPGQPSEAGCCLDLIRLSKTQIPVLGICLGHQAIVLEAGGEIVRAPSVVHGKASALTHDGQGPFAGLQSPLRVGRYHSLATTALPAGFHVHAEIDGMAMAVSHPEAHQIGLQFHPESILTPLGDMILEQCLKWLGQFRA